MSRWRVECLESPNVVYYLLLDMSGKPIARFVDEKTAEHIAKIHNEDLVHNYPEPADKPEYPLRTRIHKLEEKMQELGVQLSLVRQVQMDADNNLAKRISNQGQYLGDKYMALERKFLNHTHRISHDPAICALTNTSRPEAEEE